jgi:hypothetical protein
MYGARNPSTGGVGVTMLFFLTKQVGGNNGRSNFATRQQHACF